MGELGKHLSPWPFLKSDCQLDFSQCTRGFFLHLKQKVARSYDSISPIAIIVHWGEKGQMCYKFLLAQFRFLNHKWNLLWNFKMELLFQVKEIYLKVSSQGWFGWILASRVSKVLHGSLEEVKEPPRHGSMVKGLDWKMGGPRFKTGLRPLFNKTKERW